jgi:3-hydroxyisobutyrate dehydrogenase-like beta-hydroxyacid dehydrogenase
MTIAVLHPGQMGAAIAEQARRSGRRVLWCPAERSPATRQRADEAGLEPVTDLSELLSEADIVLSVCPPAVAEDVAEQVSSCGDRGIFVEANAISPSRCARIANLFDAALFIDGCIIGPPPSSAVSTRLYLSGPPAAVKTVADVFAGTAVEVMGTGEQIGQASALKMAYASFQKASRALAAVAHALAEHHGVRAELQAEALRMRGNALAEPDYLPSVAPRAWRWAPEMLEVAETLREAYLPDDLALATQQVLERWRDDKDRWDIDLDATLAHLKSAPETDK